MSYTFYQSTNIWSREHTNKGKLKYNCNRQVFSSTIQYDRSYLQYSNLIHNNNSNNGMEQSEYSNATLNNKHIYYHLGSRQQLQQQQQQKRNDLPGLDSRYMVHTYSYLWIIESTTTPTVLIHYLERNSERWKTRDQKKTKLTIHHSTREQPYITVLMVHCHWQWVRSR